MYYTSLEKIFQEDIRMHCTRKITGDIYYVGGSDRKLSLFENIFPYLGIEQTEEQNNGNCSEQAKQSTVMLAGKR